VSDARGGGVIALQIEKFENYYHQISSIYSSNERNYYKGTFSALFSAVIFMSKNQEKYCKIMKK
jgi:hypothetical protein